MSNGEGFNMPSEPKSRYEIGEDGTNLDRRSFLGAAIGAIAGAAALGSTSSEADARGRDSDSEGYIRESKRMIMHWYDGNKDDIYKQVTEMQSEYDESGKKPVKFTKPIDVPPSARKAFSSARMEISYEGDVGGNPTYKVQFYVTEKNGDVDCGSKTLTLRKRR